jgi:hypothetical protein
MNTTRYIFREEPITPEMAQVARNAQIKQAKERIDDLQRQIGEERVHITRLIASPLPTTIKVQVTLRPGDDGYDEAPVRFIEMDDENPWRKKLTPKT